MENIKEITEALKNPLGRFESGVLRDISATTGIKYHVIANVLHQRAIAPNNPATRNKIYKAAKELAEQRKSDSLEAKRMEGTLTPEDVQRIFKALPYHSTPDTVHTSIEDEVIVWYTGADEDLKIQINFSDLTEHIRLYDLNEIADGLDGSHSLPVVEYLEEYTTEAAIHYLRHNNNFIIL